MSTMMIDKQNGELVGEQMPNSDFRMNCVDDVEMGIVFPYNKRSKSLAIGLGSNKGIMEERYEGCPPRRIMSLPMGMRRECVDLKDDKRAK